MLAPHPALQSPSNDQQPAPDTTLLPSHATHVHIPDTNMGNITTHVRMLRTARLPPARYSHHQPPCRWPTRAQAPCQPAAHTHSRPPCRSRGPGIPTESQRDLEHTVSC
nr:MAG TPA: hypothetical protein [Caudoviricetes sp.]